MKNRLTVVWSVVGAFVAIGVSACGVEPKSNDVEGPAGSRPPAGSFPGIDEVEGNLAQLAQPCTFAADGGIMSVNLSGGEYALIGRTPLADGGFGITVNGTICGNAGNNTQRINVTSPNDGGSETVIVDYLDGVFALPTSPTGIGINIDLRNGSGDSVRVRGSSGNDSFVFATTTPDAGSNGVYSIAVGINGATTNGRRAISLTGVESVIVSTGPGNDTFATGGQADAGVGGMPWGRTLSGTGPTLTLWGGEGNDTMNGGLQKAGSSITFNGGAGTDVCDYSSRTLAVSCAIAGGAVCGESGEGTTVPSDVEQVNGGSGDDTLSCAADTACVLNGNGGDDTLNGGDEADTLNGGEGADTVKPGAGDDTVACGAGSDTVSYADRTAAVTVTLGTGGAASTGNGESGEDDSIAACENIVGGAGGDTLTGNDLDNVITGGAGDDTMSGGAGNDTFVCTSADGDDVINGQAGADTVSYASRTAALTLTLANSGPSTGNGESGEDDSFENVENLVCGSGNDTVTGNDANNVLEGGGGNDTIDAEGGDDIVEPGAGTNVVSCGAGNDILLPGGMTTNPSNDCEN